MMAGSAARAYSYREPQRAPQRTPRRDPRFGVVRGIPEQPISRTAVKAARVFLTVLLLFAALSCARIALRTATVHTMITSQDLSAQIQETTSSNAALFTQKGFLSSPTVVKERARDLGMKEAVNPESLSLAPDVVAFDSAGNLSLSASIARVA